MRSCLFRRMCYICRSGSSVFIPGAESRQSFGSFRDRERNSIQNRLTILVSLLNPVLKAMFLMEVSVDFSRYFAADSRVLIRY